LIGGARGLLPSLRDEGHAVRADDVEHPRVLAACLQGPLDAREARAFRTSLAARGHVYVACPAYLVVSTWTVLRSVGLEPKRTVFVHPSADAPATDAIVVARPAKRGGLVVELAAAEARPYPCPPAKPE
jgi:hypothetical protein